ncbi:hypothetical protein SISNIDRAFT_492978 [Sistotremastrum niveocremeum HHB9708]|uniref:Uncharacterized protein n=1 Tax=Sistotremastrum niveocremeum HHB9708 TaxID=1314777 RepID=A0A164ZDD9_9AGAM|nr:hypothetical protein SISNIDRAFT_492978 [Sistotremastrum niveocremeum HHB9708]
MAPSRSPSNLFLPSLLKALAVPSALSRELLLAARPLDLYMPAVTHLGPTKSTVAPVVAQGLLQCLSQGFLFAQAGAYAESCDPDSVRMKLSVTLLMALSLAQTMLEIVKLWLVAVLEEPWTIFSLFWLEPFLNGLICTCAQLFLIRSCWKATRRSRVVLYGLCLLVSSTFVSNIYLVIVSAIVLQDNSSKYITVIKTSPAFSYWMYGNLALNVAISGTLYTQRFFSKLGADDNDVILARFFQFTWETASLPTICMMVAVGIFQASKQEASKDYDLALLFACITGKLYCHGLLREFNLNLRSRLREDSQTTTITREKSRNTRTKHNGWKTRSSTYINLSHSSISDSLSTTQRTETTNLSPPLAHS